MATNSISRRSTHAAPGASWRSLLLAVLLMLGIIGTHVRRVPGCSSARVAGPSDCSA